MHKSKQRNAQFHNIPGVKDCLIPHKLEVVVEVKKKQPSETINIHIHENSIYLETNANIDLLDYVIRLDFYEAILNLKYPDEAIYL